MKKIQITDNTYKKMIELRSLLYTKGLSNDILEREQVIDFAITCLIDGINGHIKTEPVQEELIKNYDGNDFVTTSDQLEVATEFTDTSVYETPEEYFGKRPAEAYVMKTIIANNK